MLDPAQVPEVEADELLARYILFARHVRSSDQSVKPDAFIPHPHRELSVTRHRGASEEEIWAVGDQVAAARRSTLHGRADVTASVCLEQGLRVEAAPIETNPNHANVVDWPPEKPAQKIKAQEIAARARFVRVPERRTRPES